MCAWGTQGATLKFVLLSLMLLLPNISFAGLINISLDGTGNYYYGPDDNYTDYTVEDFRLTLTLDTEVTPSQYLSDTGFQMGVFNNAFTAVSLNFLDFELSAALDDYSVTTLIGEENVNVMELASNSSFLSDGTLFIINLLFLNEHKSAEIFDKMYTESTMPRSWDRIDAYDVLWANQQKIIFEGTSFDLDSLQVEAVAVPEPTNTAILFMAMMVLLLRLHRQTQ